MSYLSNMKPVYVGAWRKGTLAMLATIMLEVPAAPYLLDRGGVAYPDIRSKDWAATTKFNRVLEHHRQRKIADIGIGCLQGAKCGVRNLIGFDQYRGDTLGNRRPVPDARYASSAQPQDQGPGLRPTDKSRGSRHRIF